MARSLPLSRPARQTSRKSAPGGRRCTTMSWARAADDGESTASSSKRSGVGTGRAWAGSSPTTSGTSATRSASSSCRVRRRLPA